MPSPRHPSLRHLRHEPTHHTLRIELLTENGLQTFRHALSQMASGETPNLNFKELPGVHWPNYGTLLLDLSDEDPAMTVNILIRGWAVKRNWDPVFMWKRSKDGWHRCLKLAESLPPAQPRIFSRDAERAVIEAVRLT